MARPTSGRGSGASSTGFTPEQLQALSGLVERSTYKKKLEEATPKTSFWKKLFSFLSTGESSSAVYAALEGKNPLEEYGKNIIRDISGQGYDDKTYADVLEKIGMPKLQLSQMMPWAYSDTGKGIKLKKDGFLDISGRGTLGFVGDVFLNPTTYITGGGLFADAAKGKNLTNEGKTLLADSQKAIDDLLKGGNVTDDVVRQADKISQETSKLLNANKDKYFTGIKFMGQEIVPRSKALAPGRLLDKTFQTVPVLNQLYIGAKTGVQDIFKYGNDVIKAGAKVSDAGREDAQAYIYLKQAMPKRQKELIDNTYTKLKDLYKVFKKEVPSGDRASFGEYLIKNMEGELSSIGIADEAKRSFVDELVNGFKEFNTGFATAETKAIGKLDKDPLELISNYVFHMPSKDGMDLLSKNRKMSFAGRAITTGANSDKERVFSKFVDANGVEVIAKPRAMGWKAFNREIEANAITDRVLPMVARREKEIGKIKTAINNLNIKGLKIALKRKAKPLPQKGMVSLTKKDLMERGLVVTDTDKFWLQYKVGEKYTLSVDKLKTKEVEDYVWSLVTLPTDDLDKVNKLINTREKWAGDLWKEIQDISKTTQEKVAALPDSNMWWKDSAGKEYTRVGTATIGDVNRVMEKTMLENGMKGSFLETDPFVITYGRGGLSAKKIASNEFYNNVLEQFGRQGDIAKVTTRNATTRNTTVAEKVIEQIDDATGIRYVDPNISFLPKGTLLPDFIVADLQKTGKLFDTEEVGNKLLQGYDKILNEWKGSVYGWYPASHGRNLIGALYNNWLAGLNPFDSAYKEGIDIVRGKDGFITTNSGLKISYDLIRKQILARGVTGQSGMLDAVRFYKEFDPSNLHKLRNLPVSAMEIVENNVRTPLFIKTLKEGGSFNDAAKQVFKYHFDYAPEALSDFEKTVLRRVIPFYRWTRGNIPLMMEQMIAQPGKIGATFRALNQATDKEGKVIEDLLPGYAQNDVSVTRGGQTINGLGLPPVQMFQWMQNADNQFLSGLTPFVKIPVELKTGFNTFKEKAILDDDSGKFAEKYPQQIKDWLEYSEKKITKKDGTSYTIQKVDPMKKYWLYALPTGRLASILSSTMGEDEKNRFLYNISGIKTFQYDMEQLKQTQEANFENAIIDILTGEGIMGELPYIYKDSKEEAGLSKPSKRGTKRSN